MSSLPGRWWNAAAASTSAFNFPRKSVKNLFSCGLTRDSPTMRKGVSADLSRRRYLALAFFLTTFFLVAFFFADVFLAGAFFLTPADVDFRFAVDDLMFDSYVAM